MTNYSLRGTKQSRSQDRFSLVHLQVAHPHTAARFCFFFLFLFLPLRTARWFKQAHDNFTTDESGGVGTWDLGGAYNPPVQRLDTRTTVINHADMRSIITGHTRSETQTPRTRTQDAIGQLDSRLQDMLRSMLMGGLDGFIWHINTAVGKVTTAHNCSDQLHTQLWSICTGLVWN